MYSNLSLSALFFTTIQIFMAATHYFGFLNWADTFGIYFLIIFTIIGILAVAFGILALIRSKEKTNFNKSVVYFCIGISGFLTLAPFFALFLIFSSIPST